MRMKVDGNCVASFINFILEPTLDLHKLELPRKFVTTYGDDLSNIILLIIPTGKVWKLNLVKENGKAFLQNGWPEFAKFYSLSQGHCLMFKYLGNSRFHVVICDDMSSTEINYPFGHETFKEKEGHQHQLQSPHQKRKTTDLNKSTTTTSKKAKGVQTVRSVADDQLILSHSVRYGGLTPVETKRVRAYASSHCKHPSFAAKMQPSFVGSRFCMGIPCEFVSRHSNFLFDKAQIFNLRTGTGAKPWPVKTACNIDAIRSRTKFMFSGGWRNFVSDSKLKVGDVCVFEFINKQEVKVHIFRVADAEENRKDPAVKIEES